MDLNEFSSVAGSRLTTTRRHICCWDLKMVLCMEICAHRAVDNEREREREDSGDDRRPCNVVTLLLVDFTTLQLI